MGKNIFYSFGINFINLLFPLLLIPFYIKNFGVNQYGLIAVSTALLNYIYIITDYSWGVYGPIELNKINSDLKNVNRYISKVINTKLLLSFFAAVLLIIIVQFYKIIDKSLIFYTSLLLMLFSRSQNVHWIFIGINKISIYFYFYALCKISSILFIVFFIKKTDSFISVFLILGFFDTILFLISYVYLFISHDFRYYLSNFNDIFLELKTGLKMFSTNLSICSLANSSTLVLGLFVSPYLLGIYNIAEKIIMLCKNCVGVLFLGVFPKICSIDIANVKELKKQLLFLFKLYLLIFSLGTTLLLIFSDLIISFFSSESIVQIRIYLFCLSSIPIIAALSQPSYMSLLIHDKKNMYFITYLIALIINVILSITLCYLFSITGIIIALILTEIFITMLMNYFVIKDDSLNFFKTE